MGTTFMLQSADGNLAIDVDDAQYVEGAAILGDVPAGSGTVPIQPSQGWQFVLDRLGSTHYLIVSGASKLCIGIGRNVAVGADVTDDVTDPGVPLTLQAQEPIDNNYQLWDFVPITGGSGSPVFIQNPQTGYVIQIKSHATTEASILVASTRRITNESYQLWKAIGQDGKLVSLPVVLLAAPGGPLKGFSQYVFWPPTQGAHLVGLTITIDIIEAVVVDACSLQVNCNTPYLGPDGTDTEDYDRDAQWMQFGLFWSNNSITLFNQVWHRLGPVPASEFPSQTETSPPLLTLQNNTLPTGTRIILTLCTDQNDFAIGIAGLALDSSGLPIGTPIYWPALGRDSFHTAIDGGKIHQKAMAPIGAFQVVFCSNPNTQSSAAQFTSGMGTITMTASPGIAAQTFTTNPFGIATAENSNMPYDQVPQGSSRLIVQPFGFAVTPTIHVPLPGVRSTLEKSVILLEPGGRQAIIPGDAPGPPTVVNERPT